MINTARLHRLLKASHCLPVFESTSLKALLPSFILCIDWGRGGGGKIDKCHFGGSREIVWPHILFFLFRFVFEGTQIRNSCNQVAGCCCNTIKTNAQNLFSL